VTKGGPKPSSAKSLVSAVGLTRWAPSQQVGDPARDCGARASRTQSTRMEDREQSCP